MKTHILLLATVAVTLTACSRNPDPEYAPDADSDAAPATVESPAAPAPAPAAAPAPAEPAAAAAPAPDATPRLADEEAMRLGREAAQLLFAQDMAALWPRFDARVQAQAQSADNFGQLVQQIFAQIGSETSLVEEEVLAPADQPGLSVYRRRGHYMTIGQDANLLVAFNADGSIAGINIQPAQ